MSFLRTWFFSQSYHDKMILKRVELIRKIKVEVVTATKEMETTNCNLATSGLPIPFEIKHTLWMTEIAEVMERNGIFTIKRKTDNPDEWKVTRPRILTLHIDMTQPCILGLIEMRSYEHVSRGWKNKSMLRIVNSDLKKEEN